MTCRFFSLSSSTQPLTPFWAQALCGLALFCSSPGAQASSPPTSCQRALHRNLSQGEEGPFLAQALFGGSQKKWEALGKELLSRSEEEQRLIHDLLKDTKARNWFRRQFNRAFEREINAIAETLDEVYAMENFHINSLNSLEDLSLAQRRALLLVTFQKWWWEVDSHWVLGPSRWMDGAYWLSRTSRKAREEASPLALEELLSTPSQTPFLKALISPFSSERQIFKLLKSQPETKQKLQKVLSERLFWLQIAKQNPELTDRKPLERKILRTAVLFEMLDKNRKLKVKEIKELALSQDLSSGLTGRIWWGQLGLSLIPKGNAFIDVAITLALVSVLGDFLLEDPQNVKLHVDSFNNVFKDP